MQGQLATGRGPACAASCDVAEAVRRASLCFAARGFSLHCGHSHRYPASSFSPTLRVGLWQLLLDGAAQKALYNFLLILFRLQGDKKTCRGKYSWTKSSVLHLTPGVFSP